VARQAGNVEAMIATTPRIPHTETCRIGSTAFTDGGAHGEEHVLREQLTRHVPPRRPEGEPSRQLAQASAGPRERQVGDAHGPDQEHEQSASPQQDERPADVANHFLLEPDHTRVETVVDEDRLHLGKAVEVGGVQRVHLGLRLLARRSGLQARDHLPVVAVMLDLLFRGERQRPPERDGRLQEEEVLRHHPHHRVGFTREAQVLPDDVRIGALALPQTVAQDDLALAPELCTTGTGPIPRKRSAHEAIVIVSRAGDGRRDTRLW